MKLRIQQNQFCFCEIELDGRKVAALNYSSTSSPNLLWWWRVIANEGRSNTPSYLLNLHLGSLLLLSHTSHHCVLLLLANTWYSRSQHLKRASFHTRPSRRQWPPGKKVWRRIFYVGNLNKYNNDLTFQPGCAWSFRVLYYYFLFCLLPAVCVRGWVSVRVTKIKQVQCGHCTFFSSCK